MAQNWQSKYQLIELNVIDSTNTEAKRIVTMGKATPSIIFTHTQTAGRGRYSRSWESGKGNLYMSILMPFESALEHAAELSFVIGLAAHEVLDARLCRDDIKLKWPNDVFIEDNKVGGILLESIAHSGRRWIIIGIGLNLKHAPIEHSSSLQDHGIIIASREMLDLIMQSFEKYHEIWKLTNFINIRKLWLQHAYKIGKQVHVGDLNTRVSGIFESIDESGAMLIRLESREIYRMSMGEMFF